MFKMSKSCHVNNMKNLFYLFIFVIILPAACHQPAHHEQQAGKTEVPATGNFGGSILAGKAVPAEQLAGFFTETDSIEITLSGNISASCKHSGCWMDLDMGNKNRLHVTFEDGKFTIPLDAAGKHAIAQGLAIRQLIPLETLRNYAREDGKSEEEVALITEPEWTYEMVATGVLIEE